MNLYANAHDVLPAPLLREVQKHWQGTLYVPPPLYSSSNDRALNAIRSGLPAKAVAEQCGISVRRVYRIAAAFPVFPRVPQRDPVQMIAAFRFIDGKMIRFPHETKCAVRDPVRRKKDREPVIGRCILPLTDM